NQLESELSNLRTLNSDTTCNNNIQQMAVIGNELSPDGSESVLKDLIYSGRDAVRMIVTPGMAQAMMNRNESTEWKNRHRTQKNVDRISKALKDGRWAYTSEPIIFSENGN